MLDANGCWGIQKENALGYRIAIPYTSERTYTLSRIEIFGSATKLSQEKEPQVRLYTDYKTGFGSSESHRPSNNELTSGKLALSDIPDVTKSMKWLKIYLQQPIVVFYRQEYWIVLDIEGDIFGFSFGQAANLNNFRQNKVIAIEKGATDWSRTIYLGFDPEPMLRFYGRVLPVSSWHHQYKK